MISSRLSFVVHALSRRRDTRVRRRWSVRSRAVVAGSPLLAMALVGTVLVQPASAAQAVQLGTATPFAVLAYSAVTDVPISSITGNVGLTPTTGNAITGLNQSEVTGSIYSVDGSGPNGTVNNPSLLTTAQNNLSTAYNAAAGQSPITTYGGNLGGLTLTAGVYALGSPTSNLTSGSPLVLNGQGDPNAVFVFQAPTTLITDSSSVVQLENGAQACNVFWQVGSSATLGSSSTFVGTIMANASATLGSNATVQGRVLAQTGAVTLHSNSITVPSTCLTSSPTTTTTTTTATGTTATTTPTGTGGKGSSSGSGGKGTSSGSITTTGSIGSGEGSNGTGSAAGVSGTPAVVPLGSPHTGFGGATHSVDVGLIGLGALALAGSVGFLGIGIRRRRGRPEHEAFPTSS